MKPYFWLFLRFLLLVVSSMGCMSPETAESVLLVNPNAHRTTICVLPKSLSPETKFFATDTNRSVFVSDQDAEAFQRFLPQADTIFEYDLFARPSSALLLGTALHLSCPESFEVLRAPEDVTEGESRFVKVQRIRTETHRELRSMVVETCKTASQERVNQRYVGQEIGKRRPLFIGRFDTRFEGRVADLLGLRRIPEPEPSGPRSITRQLLDTRQGQEVGGIARGMTKAFIPGGTIAVDLAREADLLPEGTRTGRIAEACGELGVGVVQIAVGCTGLGVGGGLTGTGGGAPAGVPVLVGSLGLTLAGVANCGNGLRHLTIELWRSDEGDSITSSPPSESSRTQSTPKAEPAKLEPYKQGRGHHVPAKKAFEGKSGYAPGYDPQKALAIPKAELKKLGIDHNQITGAQLRKYKDFAKTGKPLTWESIAEIETAALVEAQMEFKTAQSTVAKAIQALKDAGVPAPVRIPWGK